MPRSRSRQTQPSTQSWQFAAPSSATTSRRACERFASTAEPPFEDLVTVTDSVEAAVAAIAEPARPEDQSI